MMVEIECVIDGESKRRVTVQLDPGLTWAEFAESIGMTFDDEFEVSLIFHFEKEKIFYIRPDVKKCTKSKEIYIRPDVKNAQKVIEKYCVKHCNL